MDKELINNKINDLEAELQKLKQLANEPEPRTPEAGDVWDLNGYFYIADDCGFGVVLEDGIRTADHLEVEEEDGRFTYLGTFDEVYVKISDVREALSIKDCDGDDVTTWIKLDNSSFGRESTLEALRKLNIIND